MSHRGRYVSGAFYLGGVMTGYHRYYHSLSDAATIMATYSCLIIGKHVFQSHPVKMSLRAEQLL